MRVARGLLAGLMALGLSGCSTAAVSESAAPSSSQTQSGSTSKSAGGCEAADVQVALNADPAWQVCLPSSVSAEVAFGAPPTFRATARLDGTEFVVAKMKIVGDADFAKLSPEAWLQLADSAGSHVLIDRSYNVAGDVTATQLDELTKISALLADPLRYSQAG